VGKHRERENFYIGSTNNDQNKLLPMMHQQ
jgi:hypothetical protein